MKSIAESKRWKQTGRKGKLPPFTYLLNRIIDSDELAVMPGGALKLLIDLCREYRPGKNGDISFDDIRKRNPRKWRSNDVRQRAINYLVDHGWIVRTKRGGLHLGCDLFAVTMWPIDECKGKHDYPTERLPSNLWQKNKTTYRNPVQLAPESGTAFEIPAPESGTGEPVLGPIFKVANTGIR